LAKRAKNQDLLRWALTGAKERLSALAAEIESIYRTFPSLKSISGSKPRPGRAEAVSKGARKRRRFSPAARAKLRAAAKRRWAEAKKAGKKRLG
jgi:hypothetical protein